MLGIIPALLAAARASSQGLGVGFELSEMFVGYDDLHSKATRSSLRKLT
jgi:hypothetical protein